MPDYDLIVIGGGPAGYNAALKGAERGATVALIEAERPGGACVHHACIPTNIMLGAVDVHIAALELEALGVIQAGEVFNFARAVARKNALVQQISDGIGRALAMRKVQVIRAHAAFTGPDRISLTGRDNGDTCAEAILIATGTRWEPPTLAGVSPERVLTADQVTALTSAPVSALVVGGGPADTAFALEYAFLLAVAGTNVTVATPYARLLPALDGALADAASAALTDAGISLLFEASIAGGDQESVTVQHRDGIDRLRADVVVAADLRRPFYESLNLKAAGVRAEGRIPVDRSCRTNVPSIFAAGDVTGGAMLTAAALQMGEVAATNATGGETRTRLGALPHLLHTLPEIGWIGLSEERAHTAGHDVRSGVVDLSFNARAVSLGARTGLIKLVTEPASGEILGVHIVGPGAEEVLAAAAVAMHAEVTANDLAATSFWHPSIAESLAEAARRTL